jgi:hypothetical protein
MNGRHMAKPLVIGIEHKRKNNDNKHPHVREEWTKAKKLGRSKQQWIWDTAPLEEIGEAGRGHWEKV